jgi:CRP-like cAMP-binding protein
VDSHHITNLLRKIDPIDVLSDEDKHALAHLPMWIVHLKAGQDIVRQGDRPSRSCLLIEGFASASKLTGEDNRQAEASSKSARRALRRNLTEGEFHEDGVIAARKEHTVAVIRC